MPMDTLKPWSTTIALGQRILEELKLDREMDTLGRWLAHYLAEKMEYAASAPEGATGEAARRECVELILRLWERRHAWPLSAPLKDVADRLDELLAPKPRFFHASTKTSNPFLDSLHGLEELHHRETQICLAAWISGLNLTNDREFLHSHSEHLDEDELRITQRLVEIQDLMLSPEAHLDGDLCPNFATLSKVEQGKIVRARLRTIAKSRTQLLGR
jgi:hypothetical protein